MAKSSKYYDITNLLSTKAQYLMLLGQRSNGKSYQVKKTILQDAYEYIKSEGKSGSRFIYLRRWVTDIKAKSVKSYFEDFTEFKDNKLAISDITHKEFIDIDAWLGNGVVLRCQVDARIYGNTAQHDHSCKSALVKAHSQYGECQEHADKAYRNEQHNHQRVSQ